MIEEHDREPLDTVGTQSRPAVEKSGKISRII